ncbi:MAG: radical SAM protein [Candidatus Njordarchaeia archaeon]
MFAKITITTHCNAKCKTCLMRLVKDKRHMSFNDFCIIVKKLKKMELSCLHMYNVGESYLNPQHKEIFKKGIELFGDRTVIITNGSVIDEVPEGIGHFIISFNGDTKEHYESVTGLNFEQTIENIKRLYKDGQFKKARKVEIHSLQTYLDDREYCANLKNLFSFCKDEIRIRISQKIDNQLGHLAIVKEENYTRIPCDYLKVINVHVDGTVIMCAHDFFAENKWGNLLTDPVWRILSWEDRIKKICEHNNGLFTGLCEKCNYNKEIKKDEIFYL